MVKRLFLFLLIATAPLFSTPTQEEGKRSSNQPNFGGTLLSPTAVNTPPGKWLFEPYLYMTQQRGRYNSHWKSTHRPQFSSIQLQVELETGLTNWLDLTLYLNGIATHSNSRNSYLYGDTQVSLGFQISKDQAHSWTPDFRLALQESFPSGKYQHLDSEKHFADVSGSGAYETWITAILHKTFSSSTFNLSLAYVIPSHVFVRGFNAYGGNFQTHQTVSPGQQLIANLGIEYSLTKLWILGIDIHYQHQNKSSSCQPTTLLGAPSLEQWSIAPCIEYNPSPNFGIEIGSWFTIAGRNSASFISAVGTVYWYF